MTVVSKDALGIRLRSARVASEVSLRELARNIGCSPSALSQIENGSSLPSVDLLTRLAQRLEVSSDVLLGLRGDSQPESLEPTVEIRELAILPGELGTFTRSRPGDAIEFVFVTSGELTVSVGADSWVLTSGSSVRFKPDRAPIYTNHSDQPVAAVWGQARGALNERRVPSTEESPL